MHRLGVIATNPIKKGEVVLVYGGIVIPTNEIKLYWAKMTHVGIQISDDFFICPTTRSELETTGVINHSCEPNTGFSSPIHLVAIKDIEVGQEITFDYAFTETIFEPFACECKSSNCRRNITPSDWEIKSIQEKYGEYFSPYLKERIMKVRSSSPKQ